MQGYKDGSFKPNKSITREEWWSAYPVFWIWKTCGRNHKAWTSWTCRDHGHQISLDGLRMQESAPVNKHCWSI
ncbi:S-layer homology domain-containing protein [Paenibacillus lautus]|uniref:S-layer homology domain-containing protein n=1 Tax=Paenibacillus TaxID=44249 RepID=UPI001C7D8BB2|nr:S-layer homology domain-containing protein [Paenibacillus lautus]